MGVFDLFTAKESPNPAAVESAAALLRDVPCVKMNRPKVGCIGSMNGIVFATLVSKLYEGTDGSKGVDLDVRELTTGARDSLVITWDPNAEHPVYHSRYISKLPHPGLTKKEQYTTTYEYSADDVSYGVYDTALHLCRSTGDGRAVEWGGEKKFSFAMDARAHLLPNDLVTVYAAGDEAIFGTSLHKKNEYQVRCGADGTLCRVDSGEAVPKYRVMLCAEGKWVSGQPQAGKCYQAALYKFESWTVMGEELLLLQEEEA